MQQFDVQGHVGLAHRFSKSDLNTRHNLCPPPQRCASPAHDTACTDCEMDGRQPLGRYIYSLIELTCPTAILNYCVCFSLYLFHKFVKAQLNCDHQLLRLLFVVFMSSICDNTIKLMPLRGPVTGSVNVSFSGIYDLIQSPVKLICKKPNYRGFSYEIALSLRYHVKGINGFDQVLE